MSIALQQRAKTFVALPAPADLEYVSGSIAERLIVEYADAGRLDVDGEMSELIMLAVAESDEAAQSYQGPAGEYLAESGAILTAILAEFV